MLWPHLSFVIVFRENILLCSCLYHKGKNKAQRATGFQKNGRALLPGHKGHSCKIRSSTKCVWASGVEHFPHQPGMLVPGSFVPSSPRAGPASLWLKSLAKRAELAVDSFLLALGAGVAQRWTVLVTSEKWFRNLSHWAQGSQSGKTHGLCPEVQ